MNLEIMVIFGGTIISLLGYLGNRLVNSVDELNKNVAVLISRANGFEDRIKALEHNKDD